MSYLLLYCGMAFSPIQQGAPNLHLPPVQQQQVVAKPSYYSFIGSYEPGTSGLSQLSMKNVSGTILDVAVYFNEKHRLATAVKVAYIKVEEI